MDVGAAAEAAAAAAFFFAGVLPAFLGPTPAVAEGFPLRLDGDAAAALFFCWAEGVPSASLQQ